MVVVADATPLHYLILIDEIDLLRELYGTILIPNAVVGELSRPETPPKVREWMSALPRWVKVVLPRSFDLPFAELGLGEREAISIAQASPASILLTDDRDARESAATLGSRRCRPSACFRPPAILVLSTSRTRCAACSLQNFRISDKVIESLIHRRPLE